MTTHTIALARHTAQVVGLMGVLVLTAIIRMAIFCYMDAKGI